MYNIMKSVFLKKKNLPQVTVKQSTVFSMNDCFKTHQDLIGKFKWIEKMMILTPSIGKLLLFADFSLVFTLLVPLCLISLG